MEDIADLDVTDTGVENLFVQLTFSDESWSSMAAGDETDAWQLRAAFRSLCRDD